ncbi:hypothetical protein ACYEXS_19705 [Paenibacillus sp. MAH-36]|uniref:Uncharacterized protein n=1 Tax=Paenibacillus violae TaxID=3077234 RepID=A0ABU3R7Y5_9BACL|nr:hypothetical protein [Paenibacillus sp. PFR10]MDU0200169.1 hypothetical protein [Paenibacillus sp. PFR10]
MEQWDVGIAQMFKPQQNIQAVSLGSILSVEPLAVQLGDYMLDDGHIALSSRINDLIVAEKLQAGDSVVLLTADFQQFYAMDKIGGGLLDSN